MKPAAASKCWLWFITIFGHEGLEFYHGDCCCRRLVSVLLYVNTINWIIMHHQVLATIFRENSLGLMDFAVTIWQLLMSVDKN